VALEGQCIGKIHAAVDDLPAWVACVSAEHHGRPREPGHDGDGSGGGRTTADCGAHVEHAVAVLDQLLVCDGKSTATPVNECVACVCVWRARPAYSVPDSIGPINLMEHAWARAGSHDSMDRAHQLK
jgi:hypothetical protein